MQVNPPQSRPLDTVAATDSTLKEARGEKLEIRGGIVTTPLGWQQGQ
jgi:hypothetical protein